MMHHDDFFTPEHIDQQIDQASQQLDGDRADVELLAYLRSYYRVEAARQQAMLGRIWSRIARCCSRRRTRGGERELSARSVRA